MNLPFTTEAFFDVFARYNAATWPVVVALWTAAAIGLLAVVRAPGERATLLASTVLAVLWLWGGVAYHATYFASINPAAWGFAALFVIEAGLLGWYGLVRRRLEVGGATGRWRWLGLGLAHYALAYPALNALAGHAYPAAPTFGVPCPTTIFTAGVLLTCRRAPPPVVLIPILWSVVGGSAAVLLGVAADYALLACAPILIAAVVSGRRGQTRHGGRATRRR